MRKDQFGTEEKVVNMKVIIYCRVGNPSQLASEALDRQEEYLKKYCREYGHDVVSVFKEQVSGNRQLGMELQKVMKMVLEKEVEGIMVRDLSRISRDTSSFLLFEKFMRENGAKLIDPQFGVIDFSKSVMTVHERKERE